MSPRLPSAITSSPARFAYTQTCSKAAIPPAPSASKNASCGFTATACGATASTIPQQKRATSPARRSAKESVATAIRHHGNAFGGAHRKTSEGGLAPPSETTLAPRRLGLERRLELAAGRELRHGRRGDLDALARAWVDALARCAGGRRELAEAREVHRVAGLQRLRDRLEESVDGL